MRQWFHGGMPDVPSLPASDARDAVAGIIDRGEATYQESLDGYWRWQASAASASAARDLEALRQEVLSSVAEGCAGGLQLARLPAQQRPSGVEGGDDESGRRLLALLADLRPHPAADPAAVRRAAAALAGEVEHDDGPAAEFDFRWYDAQTGDLNVEGTGRGKKGFVRLAERLVAKCRRHLALELRPAPTALARARRSL